MAYVGMHSILELAAEIPCTGCMCFAEERFAVIDQYLIPCQWAGLLLGLWEAYEDNTLKYKVQDHFLLLGLKLRITHLSRNTFAKLYSQEYSARSRSN